MIVRHLLVTLIAAASLKKFGGKRVAFSGTVSRALNLPNGLELWIAAGGKNYVAVGFKDKGAAVKRHGMKTGSKLTVDCKIMGFRPGNNISCGDCVLDERLLRSPPKP